MKKLLTFALASVCVAALSGCNTARGIGEDVQAAGEGIQSASSKVERKLNGSSTQNTAKPAETTTAKPAASK